MRIIARRTLLRFVEGLAGHRDQKSVKKALDAWFDEVRKTIWTSASDVKRLYATASLISAECIVFDIKGNDYRLDVAVDYQKSIVWIKRLGTHADSDQIDVAKVNYEP